MNVLLWIVLGILAAWAASSGVLKLTQPQQKLGEKFPWMRDASPALVRFIGIVELLGAVGLIVPKATGIAPMLTPIAAAGLAVMMLLATGLHLRRKEPGFASLTSVYAVICGLTAWAAFS